MLRKPFWQTPKSTQDCSDKASALLKMADEKCRQTANSPQPYLWGELVCKRASEKAVQALDECIKQKTSSLRK